MKKAFSLIMLFFWLMGIIGGIGYSLYCNAYPIAFGVLVTGWLSWPKVKDLWDNLME